jgi:hypothetical protein
MYSHCSNAVLAGMPSTITPPKQRQRLREAILLHSTGRRYALMVLGLVNEMYTWIALQNAMQSHSRS